MELRTFMIMINFTTTNSKYNKIKKVADEVTRWISCHFV